MRQSVSFQKITISLPIKQKGFTLLIVLAIMMVIALMVVATSQSTNSEIFMSANSADHKYAFSLADEGLRKAEERIYEKVYQYNLLPVAGSSGYAYDSSTYPSIFTRLIQQSNGGNSLIAINSSGSPSPIKLQNGDDFNQGEVVFTNNCFANYKQTGSGVSFPSDPSVANTILRGLCAPQVAIGNYTFGGNAPAWERDGVFHVGNTPCSLTPNHSSNTNSYSRDECSSEEITGLADPSKGEVYQNPRFIIEFLGLQGSVARYRITVRAWGHNPNTVVTLQSYIEVQQN